MFNDTSYLGRYVNPYTDFGFKWLFGTEVNKDLLIGFLNALLNLDDPIRDLTYHNPEKLGDTADNRKAVFDVYCESEKGEWFIVEMQKAIQKFFIDRSVYYASFPIREQAQRGRNWNFELAPVYTVGVLDFVFDESDPSYYHHEVKLMDIKSKKVVYDKLTFVYLEMPKFNKPITECTTFLDKWMFVLKNLVTLLHRPAELQERVFRKLFETAEVARFTPAQREAYEESLKIYRDLTNVVDTAHEMGVEEGREQGLKQGREEGREQGLKQGRKEGSHYKAVEIARNLLKAGVDVKLIAAASGLSIDEVNNIKSDD